MSIVLRQSHNRPLTLSAPLNRGGEAFIYAVDGDLVAKVYHKWQPASAAKCCNSVGSERSQTSPVGSFPAGASPYGCLDMAGNGYQWCTDWYDDTDEYYENSPPRNPTGPATGSQHILRGDSWFYQQPLPRFFRVTLRLGGDSADAGCDYGFRCVMRATGR